MLENKKIPRDPDSPPVGRRWEGACVGCVCILSGAVANVAEETWEKENRHIIKRSKWKVKVKGLRRLKGKYDDA